MLKEEGDGFGNNKNSTADSDIADIGVFALPAKPQQLQPEILEMINRRAPAVLLIFISLSVVYVWITPKPTRNANAEAARQ